MHRNVKQSPATASLRTQTHFRLSLAFICVRRLGHCQNLTYLCFEFIERYLWVFNGFGVLVSKYCLPAGIFGKMDFPLYLANKLGICKKISKNVFHLAWHYRNMFFVRDPDWSPCNTAAECFGVCNKILIFLPWVTWKQHATYHFWFTEAEFHAISCWLLPPPDDYFRICNEIVIVIFGCAWHKMNNLQILSGSPRLKVHAVQLLSSSAYICNEPSCVTL